MPKPSPASATATAKPWWRKANSPSSRWMKRASRGRSRMTSPSPRTGRGKEPRSGGRVRGVRKNGLRALTSDERQRARELRDRARQMRANPTPAERRLWSMLRDRRMPGIKFRRQHVIAPYIVDFVSLERLVIVEADGSQHEDN